MNDDLRVLPLTKDPSGRRVRAFHDAVNALCGDEPEGEIGLSGPRSMLWVAQQTRDAGFNFAVKHQHWVRASRIPEGDRSVFVDSISVMATAHTLSVVLPSSSADTRT